MDGGVFISYRRDDASGQAGRLSDRLRARYGKDRVFRDIDTIKPGTSFPEAIEGAVSGCNALVAVIGKHWSSITDGAGKRRLENPKDWVRLEIEAALARDVMVVPVLVDGAPMPSEEELPGSLKQLASIHALELDEKSWDYWMGLLERTLEEDAGLDAGEDTAGRIGTLLEDARRLIERGEWEAAHERLDAVLTLDPEHEEAAERLGDVTTRFEPIKPRLRAELAPAVLRTRRTAGYRLRVWNEGPAPVIAGLSGEAGGLSVMVDPEVLELEPGEPRDAGVQVDSRRTLLVGGPREHPIRVAVELPGAVPAVAEATFVQEPRVRTPLMVAGAAVAGILVAAVLLLTGSPCDRSTVAAGGTVVEDRSPNGCDGTALGGVTFDGAALDAIDPDRVRAQVLEDEPVAFWEFRRGSNAARFDGVSGWVSVPRIELSGDFTIEAWIYFDETPGGRDRIVGREECGEMIHFNGLLPGDEVPGRLTHHDPPATTPEECGRETRRGGAFNLMTSADVAPVSEWTHWAVTRSGDVGTVYENGTASVACPPGTQNGDGCRLRRTEPFQITAVGLGEGVRLTGSIAAVAIYDHALAPDRVAAHGTDVG